MLDAGARRAGARTIAVAIAIALATTMVPATASAQLPGPPPTPQLPGDVDGRAGLLPGQSASTPNLELRSSTPKPDAFASDFNSDLAFDGDHAFVGNYAGVTVLDIRDPDAPQVRTVLSCPGSQNDVSVRDDLLFVSVESAGTTDCGAGDDDARAFRGVRIFDVSDLDAPQQIAAVQTCRGSHTHTLVDDPDGRNLYVYVSGVITPRDDADDVGLSCTDDGPSDRDAARWRVDIVQVPLDAPAQARLVGGPRLFAEEGRIDGLQQEPTQPLHPSGTPYLPEPITDACHDITAYPELGLAAGACQGNGILIDITDPVNPVRVASAADPNFAYWHSATFNDDGTKVVFTDEWGGGLLPMCLLIHREEWGANAVYDVVPNGDGTFELEFASYYKIPNTQSPAENCVAHNGSLIPIPGRDVMVQAWYQGGLSVWEFTDSAEPVELAWFDRGPFEGIPLVDAAGFWSVYWHDGLLYGSEIGRGFDVLELTAGDAFSADELRRAGAAANDQGNAQAQTRYGPPTAALSPPSLPCAAVPPQAFSDVGGAPHGDNVRCIAGYGIARGTVPGRFAPAATVRRDQMASFLAQLLEVAGVELPAATASPFSDVTDANVHRRAIDQLVGAGILRGRTATSFDPAGTVDRGQMATFLVQAVEFAVERDLAAAAPPFTDTAGTTHADNVAIAFERNIAAGTSRTTFAPGRDVRRDQMGSFLAKTLRVLQSEGRTTTPLR